VSSSDLAPIGLLWWVALGHPVSFCQTSTSCHPLRGTASPSWAVLT
jgi:hypothetical protein